MIDLTVLTLDRIVASVVAGVVAGLYLVAIHPHVDVGQRRRAVLFGWFLGFPFSILYVARIALALYLSANDPHVVNDAPRSVAGWVLTLLFAAFVTVGAGLGYRIRAARVRRRIRRERQRTARTG